jgi:hypothetical protein
MDSPHAPCLQPEGLKEMHGLVAFYKENATILRKVGFAE